MRNYNFSAGPSMLPLEVLEQVQKELLDFNGTGMSVMEMSHRSKPYEAINAEAESLLRSLMNIPDNYEVIFVQGGASMQFEAIPLNLNAKKADYVLTGNFASKAFEEAKKFADVVAAASSKDKNYTYIPTLNAKCFRQDADYVHICYNNTIFGTRYTSVPDTGKIPLVADISSCILSEEIDVSKFGVLYAGAQKNVGPAGVTIVIVRKDLSDIASPSCPTMLKWITQIKEKSLYNTPPSFSTYVSMLVFRWLTKLGGVKAIQKINEEKAAMLYDFIDNSDFYINKTNKPDRSIMNIPFVTSSEQLDNQFISEAAKEGFLTLKGHKLVGGMRASIYNAMPVEGIKKLIEFMKNPVVGDIFGKNYSLEKSCDNPDGIILRSFEMHNYNLPESVLCVGRAGAGVNNIPFEAYAEKGVVVFNTPGANANAVKELVLCALLLSGRKITDAINWTQRLQGKGDAVAKLVESGKKDFVGGEIAGKKLGVVGLGAIGAQVANSAIELGMSVIGYDPYISISGAWNLDHHVKKAETLEQIYAECDFITLHVPLSDSTKNMINVDTLKSCKNGVSIINCSRGELVDNAAIIAAVGSGKVNRYVTDFPVEELLGKENIITIPHLGASTPEAEDNCAQMAARQMADFIENGNIINSVNFSNLLYAPLRQTTPDNNT
ncbi:phosphoserine aminotransferase [Holotrichia oblita]|nr:phosphoserine aminotransferase [Holotrichia oblita]